MALPRVFVTPGFLRRRYYHCHFVNWSPLPYSTSFIKCDTRSAVTVFWTSYLMYTFTALPRGEGVAAFNSTGRSGCVATSHQGSCRTAGVYNKPEPSNNNGSLFDPFPAKSYTRLSEYRTLTPLRGQSFTPSSGPLSSRPLCSEFRPHHTTRANWYKGFAS